MATATARVPSISKFELAPLPFDNDALEPIISAETLALHHDKHHRKYVDTMNELLKNLRYKEPHRWQTWFARVRATS